ncbi:MAG: hypothetical protein V7L21_12775 [Nostoc sp.]|uniref:hypothetical protein n=1 Tax=unclassified Nostoc TaxID=2593658 RepID=UPI0025EC3A5F|nr:hypothetical protein [Nostoc sp. NMS9]MBN3943245.1 hypothetical protein [Nostoc sp. NMS9]
MQQTDESRLWGYQVCLPPLIGNVSQLVPQGGIQNSKFKIQNSKLIQRKHFIGFEWVVYLRRTVLGC